MKLSSFCNSRQTKARHSLFHGFLVSNLEQIPRSLNGVPAQFVQILIKFWIEPNKLINLLLLFLSLVLHLSRALGGKKVYLGQDSGNNILSGPLPPITHMYYYNVNLTLRLIFLFECFKTETFKLIRIKECVAVRFRR